MSSRARDSHVVAQLSVLVCESEWMEAWSLKELDDLLHCAVACS
jgi:hypothetical protein